MEPHCHRRQFLKVAAGVSFASLLKEPVRAAAAKPSSPVAIARCRTYDPDTLLRELQTMMDRLGGLDKLVAGKTVAVKVNLTGNPRQQTLGLPAGRTFQVHPNLVHATAHLLDRAGAKRIRFVEGTYQKGPIEPYLQGAGWDLPALSALKATVEFEDTRNLGNGKRYVEVKVPWGGSLFPAYHLNHSYVDCDVYVSLAKLKNHVTAGVTLSMKNNFGITPTALYGHHEANEQNTSNRGTMFHFGTERPADGLPQEVDPRSPRRPSYRGTRLTPSASARSTWRSSTASRPFPAARGRGCPWRLRSRAY